MSRIRILPVVKAYPVLDPTSFSEAVCVAGISVEEPRRWVRLFPLDFRGLERARQFRKYEMIELEVSKSTHDPRPETYTPRLDSIKVCDLIDTDGGTWRRRLPYFDAVADDSMCGIARQQRSTRQSLGVFRPKEVGDLKVMPAPPEFEASQLAIIQQASLLGDRAGDAGRNALKPLPIKAKFHYRCSDGACPGHEQSLIDWELGALYRRLRDQEGHDEASCVAAVRDQFLRLCDQEHDVRFIAGSMLRYPKNFLILGLVSPKRRSSAQREALF